MLDDWHHFDLAHVHKQLVELFLVLAVEYQVSSEHEDAGSHDRQNLEAFEAENPVKQQEQLVNLKNATESKHHPLEGSLQRTYAKLVHVEADLRLVHLQKVFEELAESYDALRVAGDGVQHAEVLRIEGPEREVDLVSLITDVAERCDHETEVLHWKHSAVRVESRRLLVCANSHDRVVRLESKHVVQLPVAEEEVDATLKVVLENEVLVIVSRVENVAPNQVVECRFPLARLLKLSRKVVLFFLVDFSVQNLLVDFGPEIARDASFCILDEEWLVVFLQKPFTHQDALVYETLFFVHADLSELDIEFNELIAQFFK